MAAAREVGSGALPALSRLPVPRARDKRPPSGPGAEGTAAGPPRQKRARPGPGGERVPPRAPLRAVAAGKNGHPKKAATVVAAPRAGLPWKASTVAAAPRAGAPCGPPAPQKRPPWDLRGQVGDLREELGKARERLRELESHKQHLECGNQQLQERLAQLQRELMERERRESDLIATVGSLEVQLERSRSLAEGLALEKRRLEEEEQQRRRERDEGRAREQALSENLENTKAHMAQIQEQLQMKLDQMAALQEVERSQKSLLDQQEERIHLLEMERRRLHNDIQELKGNIRVFCRVRPVLPEESERQRGLQHLRFSPQDPKALVLTRPDESHVGRERRPELRYDFTFDRVFPPGASQQEIFQEIQLLVQSALDGYPVCIFAYGQTGSGKTFTMEGPEPPGAPESRGMIPRAVQHLFQSTHDLAGKGWQYHFSASFLEIYNESLRDLLLVKGQRAADLDIRRVSPNSDELHVPNLTWVPVETEEEVLELLQRAGSQRSVAQTGLNNRSSRSHSVFQLRIRGEQRARDLRCACEGPPSLHFPFPRFPAPIHHFPITILDFLPPIPDFPAPNPSFPNPYPRFPSPNPTLPNPYPTFFNPIPDFPAPICHFPAPIPPTFLNPQPRFPNPKIGFHAPYPTFRSPHPAFPNPNPSFSIPHPRFPNPTFLNPQPGFPNPNPTFTNSNPGFPNANSAFSAPYPTFPSPSPRFPIPTFPSPNPTFPAPMPHSLHSHSQPP
ncbi:kinesin-like protein KIFC1 isoform X3 [Myiozetetes cayanensis]|uniref:kinesin-like protein KIFC1 isoform X3 n=1 Tax=Myiozetetes cayanensis TaxID=478635 RepID=UPI0021608D31|nr:kinesin-like protein KIFC1 isoform X3 [Myiozetetes cayanensis]